MPCFAGLAVSIHTPDGPVPEYSIQRQRRFGRITSYIPVPAPKISPDTGLPGQSTFAISITLLVPSQNIPYSTPKPTLANPNPKPKVVAPAWDPRGGATAAYSPLTPGQNETIAAYIHFDGRAKEEVATLLRRGEETWVNSRWVKVPESDGGGLAEREFMFREVGLEGWLNGLDLQGKGKDVASRIERRRQKLAKERKRAQDLENSGSEGADGSRSPMGSDLCLSEQSDSDMPSPEAAGQIRVSLFRVLASGEVKKGEYSPQFDIHEDDDEENRMQNTDGNAGVDHTTTFAKPKSLDPKSISTQTVTGIDLPNNPYAVFTFFYRGEKQLQKMGILETPAESKDKPTQVKRKSRQLDFSSLSPLKPEGTVGFAGYRDSTSASTLKSKNRDPDDMDSDADDEDEGERRFSKHSNGKVKEEPEEKDEGLKDLSAEELSKRGELADGVKKIQLKRQHSFEPHSLSPSLGNSTNQSSDVHDESTNSAPTPLSSKWESSPQPHQRHASPPYSSTSSASMFPNISSTMSSQSATLSAVSPLGLGSPFKKARPSISDDEPHPRLPSLLSSVLNGGIDENDEVKIDPQLSPNVEVGKQESEPPNHQSTNLKSNDSWARPVEGSVKKIDADGDEEL